MGRKIFIIKIILSIMIFLPLILYLFSHLILVNAWYGGPIRIRPDGSILPYNAPIATSDKITYILTDDIQTSGDGIIVERDNIILNGQGHTIVGSGSGAGIRLYNIKNVTVKNVKAKGFESGIFIRSSSNNKIINNIFSNNVAGIYLYQSSLNNIIINNTVSNNSWCGIHLEEKSNNNTLLNNAFINCGLLIRYSYLNNVVNNTVNNRPLVYLENASDLTIKEAGQIILINCKRIEIKNLNFSNVTIGIELWESSNNVIINNNSTSNWAGIYLHYFSNNNIIIGNMLFNNKHGIRLESSNNNTIIGNTFLNNSLDGILFDHSFNNTIYHNNFINNTKQVYSYSSINTWDNGYPSGGNYWSDYTGSDKNLDGIGDTSYIIDYHNIDHYPLIKFYIIISIPSETTTTSITLTTLTTYTSPSYTATISEIPISPINMIFLNIVVIILIAMALLLLFLKRIKKT